MLVDNSCLASNTNVGNNPELCLPLRPFVKKSVDANCELSKAIPLTENIGMVEPIQRSPGCNPITYSNAVMCSQGIVIQRQWIILALFIFNRKSLVDI